MSVAGAEAPIVTRNIHPMTMIKSSDSLLPFISRQHQQQHHRRQHQHWHSSAVLALFVSRSSSTLSTHHRNNRTLSPTFHKSRKSTEFSLAVSTANTTAAPIGDGAGEFVPEQQHIPLRHKASNRKDGRRKVSDINRERNARMHSLYLEEISQNNKKMSTTTTAITTTTTTTTSDSGHDNTNNHIIDNVPRMFAVKVVTCPMLQSELNMNGREKRGRMFVERPSYFSSADLPPSTSTASTTASLSTNSAVNYEVECDMDVEVGLEVADGHACTSLSALRRTIHEFFRRLQKGTYILSASLPEFDEEGNILIHDEDGDIDDPGSTTISRGNVETWPLESDDDVRKAFNSAEEYFLQHQRNNLALKRPTLVLHVTKDPNAPPLPPPPAYLTKMSDPKTSPTMTMLSFYAFPPHGIADPESTAELLKRTWKPFTALGRVYIANEGVNAQMSVPTNVLSAFLTCCCATTREDSELYSILGQYVENGINVDPDPVDREEFEKHPPFTGLHIRVRDQIVADGFDKPLNWQSAGYDMPPLEWHQRLKEARMKRKSGLTSGEESLLPIVLDCRNDYESNVGNFLLAEPLNTTNFRESWDVLKERLKDVPKDAPIMTYCTGGIRCVKVNAYLTQELEFTNVSRLAGGVVAYDRTLREHAPMEEPMFKGVNYVFDGRMGRKITDDQLGTCYTCGGKTNLVTNCKNENCHRRMVQCNDCSNSFFGTCSGGCRTRILNSGMLSLKNLVRTSPGGDNLFAHVKDDEEKKDSIEDQVFSTLDDYSSAYSSRPPSIYNEIELNSASLLPTGAHMVSGSIQGSLLTTLASLSREGRILEIGTFTGYATARLLEGAAAAGACFGTDTIGTLAGGGPFVLSLERDRRALALASAHLKVMTDHGVGDVGASEASRLRDVDPGTHDVKLLPHCDVPLILSPVSILQ